MLAVFLELPRIKQAKERGKLLECRQTMRRLTNRNSGRKGSKDKELDETAGRLNMEQAVPYLANTNMDDDCIDVGGVLML